MILSRTGLRTFRASTSLHHLHGTSLASTRYFSITSPVATRISELIKNDHRELENAYNKILSATNRDEQERWQNQFTWELARHSIGEELVVYPSMEKHLNNGRVMADQDRQEHQVVSSPYPPPKPRFLIQRPHIFSTTLGERAPIRISRSSPRGRSIYPNS
jgi:hypothetical protein